MPNERVDHKAKSNKLDLEHKATLEDALSLYIYIMASYAHPCELKQRASTLGMKSGFRVTFEWLDSGTSFVALSE